MEYVIAAFSFGLAGGLNPGVLSIYVLQQTMQRGDRAGLVASFAPFVSDGPIILVVLFLLSAAADVQNILVWISFAGAAYLLYLAASLWRGSALTTQDERHAPASFLTAVKVNLLNPAPYMFWSTVGSAYLLRGNTHEAISFIVVMLTTLALSKFAFARTIALLGKRASSRIQAHILKALAVLLAIFAVRLLLQNC